MKRRVIPPKKRLYRVGSGPHWDEANVLRRKLGAHAVLLAIVDEKGGIHVTGQTEPQSISLFGAACNALQELAHRIQHLGLSPEHWQAEEMSEARVRRPPQTTEGEVVDPVMVARIPPALLAKAALAYSPEEWKIEPPKEEKPD